MNERLIAWQAGIVDGEGCLTISRQIRKGRPSPAFRPMVTVSNTNIDLLRPFLDSWGGAIYLSREDRNNWLPAHTWHCPDARIKEFLTAIMDDLRGKRAQAELILIFIANKKKFRRIGLGQGKGSAPLTADEVAYRMDLWNQIRALNAKGQYARSLIAERGIQ